MKNNHIRFCNIFELIFYVLVGVSIVIIITIGNLPGVWLILIGLGMPWSIIPIESDTQTLPHYILLIHAWGSVCINLIIVSVICWKNGHKSQNKK
jgi:hypothetical protein